MGQFEELTSLLASPRAGERLRAMDAASVKRGGHVVRLIDDDRVVPLLIGALADADRRVQRAAARGLRPWLAESPELMEEVLDAYAASTFDGSYSHAGLHDTCSGRIWVPKFAAVRGHAALLADANTDRYFRFTLYAPGQAPAWVADGAEAAHLLLFFVPEWSYARQQIIAGHDERRRRANRREQQRYADDIVAFYRDAALAYPVRVHEIDGAGGRDRSRQLDVAFIPPGAPAQISG